MYARVPAIGWEELETAGHVTLRGLVAPAALEGFERDIAAIGSMLCRRRGVTPVGEEPIAALLKAAGAHRSMLFDHIKRLFVLTELAADIGRAMQAAGLFERWEISVPIVWATLRADLPGELAYAFPLHQDYVTTRCATSWRMWIPLRDVDRHHGTLQVASGSHRGGPYRYVVENTTYPHIEPGELSARGFSSTDLMLRAGDAVLFDPRLVHASIPNRSPRTKWVLLLHIQDLAGFLDPEDHSDPLRPFLELTSMLRGDGG